MIAWSFPPPDNQVDSRDVRFGMPQFRSIAARSLRSLDTGPNQLSIYNRRRQEMFEEIESYPFYRRAL